MSTGFLWLQRSLGRYGDRRSQEAGFGGAGRRTGLGGIASSVDLAFQSFGRFAMELLERRRVGTEESLRTTGIERAVLAVAAVGVWRLLATAVAEAPCSTLPASCTHPRCRASRHP